MTEAGNERRRFVFTDEEAAIVARCEIGVGDLPRRLYCWMAIALLFVFALRPALGMPLLPSFAVLGCYAAAAAAWIILMVYIDRRLKITARDIASRELYLYFGKDGVEMYEDTESLRYHAPFPDISLVERGDRVCRITAPMGRICFPLRLLSAEELRQLDGLENAGHLRRDWM